jgi:hypothetical protein
MGRTPARLPVFLAAWLVSLWAATDSGPQSGKDLLDAASQGRTASVQDLVAKGAPLETKDKNGRTPLMLAAQHGHAATVRFLLEKGADPAARDQAGATAWVLAMFAPAGNRGANDEVLKLLPQPPRPKVAVEAVWSASNLYSSCVMRLDQLARMVTGFQPDLAALTAFGKYAVAPGRGLIEIAGANARGAGGPDDQAYTGSDAVLILTVRPGVACLAQESADQLSLSLDVQLVRSKDRAVLLHKSIGGTGLKGLRARTVTGEAQYFPVYQEWIKPYSEQAWRDAVEAWYQAE